MSNIELNNAKFIFNYIKGTFIPNRKSIYSISVINENISINNNNKIENKEDLELSKKIEKIIENNIEKIKYLSQKSFNYIKDSSKDEIFIKFDNKQYCLSNKTKDKELNIFYEQLINDIMNLIGN